MFATPLEFLLFAFLNFRYSSQLSKEAKQNFTGTSQNNLALIKETESPRLKAESSCADKPVKSMYSSSVLVNNQQAIGLIANLPGEVDQDKTKVRWFVHTMIQSSVLF